MSKGPKTPAPFPTRDQILEFINDSPTPVGKREIARAFHLDAEQKKLLKKVLRELEQTGEIQKGRGRKIAQPGALPEVTVVKVIGTDLDGDPVAEPLTWSDELGPKPKIYMHPERKGQPALGPGDRILARLNKVGEKEYEGKTIRRIAGAPPRVMGQFIKDDKQFRIRSTDRKDRNDYVVSPDDTCGAQHGELVRAEVLPGRRLGLRQAKVLERLEDGGKGIRAISLIAIHDQGIPTEFSPEAQKQADKAKAAPMGNREDLRKVPLVTIDGSDARDFDDAVFAEADDDPKNPGGWHLIVAIADVAWYVRPKSPLDNDAFERGNSVYFPDRVVPMLPEVLSNGWCSLRPDEDRPVLAVHMWIDSGGNLKRHTFVRGMIRSFARLTYEQAQAARDGCPDETTGPLVENVIEPLFTAWKVLEENRRGRGALDIDMPERRVFVDETSGDIVKIEPRKRLDAHKVIEEFMITANVAAATELERLGQLCMYRIHDEPPADKLEALRGFLEGTGVKLPKGQVMKPKAFNGVLEQAQGRPVARMINELVLRTQSQAEYSPENIGHFGLALHRYAHFTSPIRRYADLLVHRALIQGLKLGDGGLEPDHRDFRHMGEHISDTERRATMAERSAVDRFTAAYLAEQVGSYFPGKVNGVTRFGLFITLEESGADGLVPISSLPNDFYIHDEKSHQLRGRRTKRTFTLGDPVFIMLVEADPISGSMIFQIVDEDEATGKRSPHGSRGSPDSHKSRNNRRNRPQKGGAKKGRDRARQKKR